MIVHIITRLAMGGAQQVVYDISKDLVNLKREVIVLTGLSNEKTSLSALDNKVLDLAKKNKIPLEIISSLNDKISLKNDLIAFYKILQFLKITNPRIVHIHSSKTGILARLACKLINLENVIYHVHGWSFSREKGLKKKIYLYLERLFFFITKKYIFVCYEDISDFIKLGGSRKIKSKASVAYPAANFISIKESLINRKKLREKLGFKDKDYVIGSVGRLDYQKNPIIFVKIAKIYSEIDKDARFLWIGKGALYDSVKYQIDKCGLSKKFILPGYIEDVEPYFSVFDTFSLTSRYEGLPLTSVKALACGKPIVGFNVNGLNDLNKMFKMAMIAKNHDINGFIQYLSKAKSFPKLNKHIAEKETKLTRKIFNKNLMFNKILDVYENI